MQVTIRDLTVRAADCPDMASLFFFFKIGDPALAVRAETGCVCWKLEKLNMGLCLILLYSHKEVLHLKTDLLL